MKSVVPGCKGDSEFFSKLALCQPEQREGIWVLGKGHPWEAGHLATDCSLCECKWKRSKTPRIVTGQSLPVQEVTIIQSTSQHGTAGSVTWVIQTQVDEGHTWRWSPPGSGRCPECRGLSWAPCLLRRCVLHIGSTSAPKVDMVSVLPIQLSTSETLCFVY